MGSTRPIDGTAGTCTYWGPVTPPRRGRRWGQLCGRSACRYAMPARRAVRRWQRAGDGSRPRSWALATGSIAAALWTASASCGATWRVPGQRRTGWEPHRQRPGVLSSGGQARRRLRTALSTAANAGTLQAPRDGPALGL